MKDRVEPILDGVLGVFLPLSSAQVPDLGAVDLIEGWMRKSGQRLEVELVADAWRPPQTPEQLPRAIVGATTETGILLLQIDAAFPTMNYGAGRISSTRIRGRSLVADARVVRIHDSRPVALQVSFAGLPVLSWSGLEAIEQTVRNDDQMRVAEVDIRLRSTPDDVAVLRPGISLSVRSDWQAGHASDRGIDIGIGAAFLIESRKPRDTTQLVDVLHAVQDLVSLAFGGYKTATKGRARLLWVDADERAGDAQFWNSSLMADAGESLVAAANTSQLPLFELGDLGGAAGLVRWVRLYDRFPRAVAPLVNSVRAPSVSPFVSILELSAAIEFFVNKHSKKGWRDKGASRTAALAFHAGKEFAAWVGDVELWADEFQTTANLLKHDPSFDPDPLLVHHLAFSARQLLLAVLLSRAARNRRFLKRFFAHHRLGATGSYLTKRYED